VRRVAGPVARDGLGRFLLGVLPDVIGKGGCVGALPGPAIGRAGRGSEGIERDLRDEVIATLGAPDDAVGLAQGLEAASRRSCAEDHGLAFVERRLSVRVETESMQHVDRGRQRHDERQSPATRARRLHPRNLRSVDLRHTGVCHERGPRERVRLEDSRPPGHGMQAIAVPQGRQRRELSRSHGRERVGLFDGYLLEQPPRG